MNRLFPILTSVALVISMALATAHCKRGPDEKKIRKIVRQEIRRALNISDGGVKDSVKDGGAQVAKARKFGDGSSPPTPKTPQVEKLLLDLKTCQVDRYGISFLCSAYKAFRNATRYSVYSYSRSSHPEQRKVAVKHLKHTSPAVRLGALKLVSFRYLRDQGLTDMALRIARQEKHPAVLVRWVELVGMSAKGAPAAQAFLMAMADHQESRIRSRATRELCYNPTIPGAYEKVTKLLQWDPDPAVKRTACEHAHRFEKDGLLPIYRKLTEKGTTDASLYKACMLGLVKMWVGFRINPNRKAFELSLRRLSEKPRSKKTFPWRVIYRLGRRPKIGGGLSRAVPAWYKKKRVVKLLSDLARDFRLDRLIRKDAIRALRRLEAHAALLKLARALRRAASKDPQAQELVRFITARTGTFLLPRPRGRIGRRRRR